MKPIVALFGEAERGELHQGYLCDKVPLLFDYFGEPPQNTKGLFFATKLLMLGDIVLYFRVLEEGFSIEDYIVGLNILKNRSDMHIDALFLPGASIHEILDPTIEYCVLHKTALLMSEDDFYDFCTAI